MRIRSVDYCQLHLKQVVIGRISKNLNAIKKGLCFLSFPSSELVRKLSSNSPSAKAGRGLYFLPFIVYNPYFFKLFRNAYNESKRTRYAYHQCGPRRVI